MSWEPGAVEHDAVPDILRLKDLQALERANVPRGANFSIAPARRPRH